MIRMPRKCCIYGCRTNFDTALKDINNADQLGQKIPVFRFPKQPDERERWCKAVPNANFIATDNKVICELHWPENYEREKKYGKFRPVHPPSIWPGVTTSQVPTPLTHKRSTERAECSKRVQNIDEMENFQN